MFWSFSSRSEFLAVRNADGGFFLCQAINNVYKSSPKIRIRWLSEETNDKNIYGLDFYDWTDIECVLTSVSLNKLTKGKFELVPAESDRITSILKKALDVEKGIVERSDLTEDNPDGCKFNLLISPANDFFYVYSSNLIILYKFSVDLSLYKDESQIEKKGGKRKAGRSAKKASPAAKKRKFETPMGHAKLKSSAKAKVSIFRRTVAFPIE